MSQVDDFLNGKSKPSEIDSFLGTQPESKPAGALRKLGDLGVGFASGAVGATKAIASAAGAGNKAAQVLGSLNDGINDYLSDEAKADQKKQGQIIADASGKGTWEGIKAGAEAFAVAPVQTAVQGLGSVVPLVAGTALTGGALPAAAVGAGLGVAMGAGTAKGAIYDEIKKRGGTEEQAIKAQEYGGENTDQIALGGVLGAADALTGVSKAATSMMRGAIGKEMAQQAAQGAGSGILARTAKGVLGEVPLEAAQGGQEQVAANLAAQRTGYEAGTWDNVASNATMEALASAGPGGAFGALGGSTQARDTAKPGEVTPVAPPEPAGQLGYSPDPLISFPDGTVGRQEDVDAYVAKLPEREQMSARARLMGLAPQPATPAAEVAPEVAPVVPPSVQMGINPAAGVISAVAAQAVDSGQTQEIQLSQAAEQDQAVYEQAMAEQEQQAAEQDTADKPITSGPIADAQLSEEDKRAILFSNEAVADGGRQYEGTINGDILNGMGQPFATRYGAARRANLEGKDWTIAPVFDGWVARRKDAVDGASDGVRGAAAGSSEQGSDQPAPGVGLGATDGNGVGTDARGRADDAVGESRQLPGGADDKAVVSDANQALAPVESAQTAIETVAQETHTPGEPLPNGFFSGPAKGEKFRVSDVAATGGLTLDKRLRGGTISTMYVGVDGGFVDADNVNLIGDGASRLWSPLTDSARQAAREILQEMGTLALGDKRREELKAKLKQVVANDGKPSSAAIAQATTEKIADVQDATPAATGTQTEAAPVEAGTPVAGDAAPAEAVPGAGSAPVESAGVEQPKKPDVGPASLGSTKADMDHLFGVDQKRAKAIERVNAGKAWFGNAPKAGEFINKNGLKDTHEWVKTGASRFEVRAKNQTNETQAPANAAQEAINSVATTKGNEDGTQTDQTVETTSKQPQERTPGQPVNEDQSDQAVYADAAAKFNALVPKLQAARDAGNQVEIERLRDEMRPLDLEMRGAQSRVQNRALKRGSEERANAGKQRFANKAVGERVRPSEFPSGDIYWEKGGDNQWSGHGAMLEGKSATDFDLAERGGLVDVSQVAVAKPTDKADDKPNLRKTQTKRKANAAPVVEDKAQSATKNVAKPDAKAALSEREKAAKAKMFNALGKLATLAGKNTRMNWTQEEEQQLLPIVIELFDGAMELGAVSFQQAVAYVRDFISTNLDSETADAIPFDTLQGAYISVAGRHKDKAVTPKKEVVSFESLAELGTPESARAEQQGRGTLTAALSAEILSGKMPKDNPALKKLVEAFDGQTADQSRMKEAQEALEAAIVSVSRDVVAKNEGPRSTFDALLRLYESQPNLNIRTSTSIANQAYSTPAPLAFLGSELAGVSKATTVYEPTAGNGMLTIGAKPSNVTVNELEAGRIESLKAQGFKEVLEGDALEAKVSPKSQDRVMTNPPFGSVKDYKGIATKVLVDGFKIGQIDHLIAARALETMKDDGRATLIIGANKVAGGLNTDDRIFFNWLYGNYNVTSHFEVEGDLYQRQGAGWPVRVITISGRVKSGRASPVAGTIQRAQNWEQVYEHFAANLDANRAKSESGAVSRPGGEGAGQAGLQPVRQSAGKPNATGSNQGQAGSAVGARNVAGASAGNGTDSAEQPNQQLGGADSEQRLNAESVESDRLDPAGDSVVTAPAKSAGSAGATALSTAENQFQVTYEPRSSRKDGGVLIPVNMKDPTQDALSRLEDAVGNIDDYAVKQLGYKSAGELHGALMGLQVDSVASAIYQIEQGKGVIIADQTGIGKGRQAAAVIRWAERSGHIPVFVSVKPSLFTDMYGDLHDIGSDNINPFILNKDESIKGPGDTKLFANKAIGHKQTMERIRDSGQLPAGSNAIFMTYSQVNTDNVQRQMLTALADRAVFILDESHNAGGQSNTGEFITSLLEGAKGVTYLSATYAKRPDNMPLYFKTDIGQAAADNEGLMQAMANGGLPLQTVVSNNLVKAGQMFRRERSYDGVSIETIVDTKHRADHEALSDETTKALRAIVDADAMFHEVFVKQMNDELQQSGGAVIDNAGNQAQAGVDHTQFSSVVHNFVKQMLLGLKAQRAADDAIAALKRDEKPIIAVENTMGSFLEAYAKDNMVMQGGDLGSFDYRTVLSRALARTRVLNEVRPNGEKVKREINLSQLDEKTREAYAAAQQVIDSLELDIPVSPIDWIRNEVRKAGFTIAEITGRKLAVDYSVNGKATLGSIDTLEQTDKVRTTQLFNSGRLDALILNVAGSTGISLHASEKFQDQRQRHMIIAQAAGDINIFMQMLGRVHRTGQVKLPKYSILSVDLPTEKRPTAVLSGKMKSLNANTSSNTDSATSIKTVDMFNKYGDKVVSDYLRDNYELARALSVEDLIGGDETTDDLARKATGRLALQPIEVQHAFYEEVEAQYSAMMEYLNKTNQNDLEPRTFDYDAQETRQDVLFEGANKDSPFGEDAIYGEYSIKAQGKAMTPAEIREAMTENLSGQRPDAHVESLISGLLEQWAKKFNGDRAKHGLVPGAFNADKYRTFVTGIYGKDSAEAFVQSALAKIAKGEEIENITPARLSNSADAMRGITFMRNHAVGNTFRVDINGDMFNAVVTNIRSTHKVNGNPFSLSKIQVTLALNGALRSITVPATQFQRIEVSSIGRGYTVEQLFKEQPANQRETAKIVTGNLLAAYGELTGVRGTIIAFTKQDGTTEQGILLPKTFDFKSNTRGDYRLPTAQAAFTFLQKSENKDIGRFGIQSRDGVVRVLPAGNGVSVLVPKSKLKGGKYFLDKGLIEVFGDFVTSGSAMKATTYVRDKAVQALDLLMKKNALYAIPSMAEEAKDLTEGDTPTFSRTRPAFSRGAQVQANESVEAVAMAIASKWENTPEIIVAFDMNDPIIPEAVRKEDQRQRSGGATGTPEGFYYKGQVYLMSSKLGTANDIARVLFHETLGHYGLRSHFGKEMGTILRDVATLRRAEVDAKIKQYGLKGINLSDRLVAAEEVLAELAQTRPEIGFVKRAIAAVRTWLRQNVPGFASLRLSDAELIRNYILPARQFVENGGGPKGGVRVEPTFSRSAEQTQSDSFKRWFGDSKVVDADGKPLVVYHGTIVRPDSDRVKGMGDITSFDRMFTTKFRSPSIDTVGSWFSTNPGEGGAQMYSGNGQGSAIYPVYLSIKNPQVTTFQLMTRRARLLQNGKDDGRMIGAEEVAAYRKWLNDTGKDGIKIEGSGSDNSTEFDNQVAWIALEPEQIKSATGNNGDFDPENADIRFSRTLGETVASATNNIHDVSLPAGYTVGDFFKSAPGKLSWWHKTVGTMYDLAQRSPEFKRVFDGVQNFINDVSYYATEAADLAPNILPKLESWKDITKSPLSPEDTKAISAPIFEGTLTWARDESGKPIEVATLEAQAKSLTPEQKAQRLLRNDKVDANVLKMWQGLPIEQYETIIEGKYEREMLKAGIVWTPAELRQQFKLTGELQADGRYDGQIGLYQEFRKATDKSLTNLAISDMLRFGGKDTAPIRERVLAAANVVQAGDMLRDYLMDLSDMDQDRKDVLLDTANKMVEKSEKAKDLIERGYAPLSRYGQYTLDVVSQDGERVYFGMFESKMDASRMARRLEQEYPGATMTRGTVSEEEYKLFAGVSPETLELFGDMLGLEAQGDGAAAKAFQTYLKLAKSNRSSMKRMIQRKGTAGFSEDSGRVLAGFVYSNARQTASNLHMGEMTEAANEVPKKDGELKDQAVRLVDYVKNPREEAQAFRGLLFAQYIGGSIASAMVNMTQPLTMTFPWLSQYGTVSDAAKQMTAAMRDANKSQTGDARLDAALKRAEEDGTVSPQEVHQLMQQSQGRGALQSGDGTRAGNALAAGNNFLSRVSLGWGKLFGLAEQFNRRATFIAAYRMAVANGMKDPDAFARKAIAETQGVYNKGNKPAWARGAVGSTLFTFKQYSIAYMEMLHRMYKSGPEGKKAALLALAVLFLMSGAGGLPGSDDLDDLISGLLQRMGYNFDTKAKRKEFFASLVGEGGAQFLETGISGLPGMPLDVSGRLGMGNLIPGTGVFQKKADYTRDVLEIAGPGGDFVKRGFDAAGKVIEGDVLGLNGAVRTIAPKAVQNLYQSYDMASMGMYRDAKGMKVLDTDGYDATLKAIGFQPNDVKKVQDASFEAQRMIGLNRLRESEIANRWALGIFEKDSEKVRAAREELREWNETNPGSPIRINFKQILQRVQKMNQTKAERIAATAPKEIRNDVRNSLVTE